KGKKYHWAPWETLSYPYKEGGIGVRELSNVCISLQYKQWWNFRTKRSLWGGKQVSVWKYMMRNKHLMKAHIKWKIHLEAVTTFGGMTGWAMGLKQTTELTILGLTT
ncbi:hypothetical protein H5410_060554, partial [Solanum commersonii]